MKSELFVRKADPRGKLHENLLVPQSVALCLKPLVHLISDDVPLPLKGIVIIPLSATVVLNTQ